MKVILLAAGRGSRMKNLTETMPKCFMELNGRKLFDWQLDAMRSVGLDDIIVARGYKKECLSGDFIVVDNDRWSETNMVGTLLCASQYLEKEVCIVSYADIVYHPEILKKLKAKTSDIVITYDTLWYDLWSLRFEDPLSDAETFKVDAKGSVSEIGQKPQTVADVQGQYMGLLKFTPVGWGKISTIINSLSSEEQDRLDMTSLLNKIINAGHEIDTVAITGRWVESDSEDDLNVYHDQLNKIFQNNKTWAHDWRW
jgi:choline kinase